MWHLYRNIMKSYLIPLYVCMKDHNKENIEMNKLYVMGNNKLHYYILYDNIFLSS